MTSIRRSGIPFPDRRPGIPFPDRQPPAGSPPSLAAFFFWITFLVTTAIGYLWVFNQNDVLAANIVEQQSEIALLENSHRDLQVTIDALSQIDRITRIARLELGMVAPPAESLIVYLPELPR